MVLYTRNIKHIQAAKGQGTGAQRGKMTNLDIPQRICEHDTVLCLFLHCTEALFNLSNVFLPSCESCIRCCVNKLVWVSKECRKAECHTLGSSRS